MKEELFYLSCMRYLEVSNVLPYEITDKHYNSEITLGSENNLDKNMTFLFFNKKDPKTTNSISVLDNPLRLSPISVLTDLEKKENIDYDYAFVYFKNKITIYDSMKREKTMAQEFIKGTKNKIKKAQ